MASAPPLIQQHLHEPDSPNHFYLYRSKSQPRGEKQPHDSNFLPELVLHSFPPPAISSEPHSRTVESQDQTLEGTDFVEEHKGETTEVEIKGATGQQPAPPLDAILHESDPQEAKKGSGEVEVSEGGGEREGAEEEEERKKEVFSSPYQNSSLSEDLQPAEKAISQQRFYSKRARLQSACSGDSSKGPEAFSPSAITTATMKCDLLASSPNDNGSISSIPPIEVQSVLQSCIANAEIVATKLLQEAMDTVQSQVLCALQQAANETFDDLKKDAAHRILIAEKRAMALEHELSMVKQHALTMLLRLKTNNDAKVVEMEKRYLTERRRAQDAEAKLITAQDTSKKLKLELRKKREIIEKMQKFVQPINVDYQQALKRITDTTVGCAGNLLRDETQGMKMHSPENRFFPNMGDCSLRAVSQMAHQDVPYTVFKPDVAVVTTTTSIEDESKPVAETVINEGTMELPMPTSSLIERVEHVSVLHTDGIMQESSQEQNMLQIESRNSGSADSVDELNRLTVVELKPGRVHTKANHKHKDWVDPNSGCFETTVPIVTDGHPNTGDANLGSSDSSIKGIYVRRKVRMNGGQYTRKVNNGSAMVKPCVSMEEDIHISDFAVLGEMELRPKVEMENLDNMVDVHISPVDVLQIGNPKCRKHELLEGKALGCADGDDSESIRGTSKGNVCVKSVEFARPDYEVATSLTELAFLGQELPNHKREVSPSMKREDVFIKPGRTGLRMKRMGVSFQRNVSAGVGRRITKKAKLDKDDVRILPNSIETCSKRTKVGKSTTAKDVLSVESSRDSRRLLQGARQLLCLAEKKWG